MFPYTPAEIDALLGFEGERKPDSIVVPTPGNNHVRYTVLWWVPAGHPPTVEEAKERLNRLNADGPTDFAWTFREPFPAPLEPYLEA